MENTNSKLDPVRFYQATMSRPEKVLIRELLRRRTNFEQSGGANVEVIARLHGAEEVGMIALLAMAEARGFDRKVAVRYVEETYLELRVRNQTQRESADAVTHGRAA